MKRFVSDVDDLSGGARFELESDGSEREVKEILTRSRVLIVEVENDRSDFFGGICPWLFTFSQLVSSMQDFVLIQVSDTRELVSVATANNLNKNILNFLSQILRPLRTQ